MRGLVFPVRLWFPCCFIILNLGMPLGAAGQDSSKTLPTNLQCFQTLAAQIADSIAAISVPSDSPSILVTVDPADLRWFLEGAVMQTFRTRGWRMAGPDSARYSGTFGLLRMRVTYANVRRTGLFGAKLIDRKVQVVAMIRIEDVRRKTVVWTGERGGEFSDTVELSDVESLEHPSIPATHGAIPQEGFFSGWIEPVVIIGAIAVALFLLFTVRS